METKTTIDDIHAIMTKKALETLNDNKKAFEDYASKHVSPGSDLDNLIRYLLRWQHDYLSEQTFDSPCCIIPALDDFFPALSYLVQMYSGATGVVLNPTVSWKKYDEKLLPQPSHKDELNSFPEISFHDEGVEYKAAELLELIAWTRANDRLNLSTKKKAVQEMIETKNLKNKHPEIFEKYPGIFLPAP